MANPVRSVPEISSGRKVAAAVAMTATAGLVAREAIGHWHIEWLLLTFAGILGAAGIGMTRKSLVAQVLSRGAAWIVLLPALLVIVFGMLRGSMPPIELGGLAAGTGSALFLARPMLHTKEAREAFAPKAFRSWFLAGSTATAATAFVAGGIALDALPNHLFTAGAFGALSISLLASAIGVVRMRGWGILLGAATSLALLVTAAFMRADEGMELALAAAPALLLHLLPVLVARVRGTPSESSATANTHVRVSTESESESVTPAFYRIATDAPLDEAPVAEAPRRAAAVRA